MINGWGENAHYGDFAELKKHLLYHRIVKWLPNTLVLDDGTKVSIVESEQDCCATAGGTWEHVKLDAVITDVSEPETENVPDDDTRIEHGIVTIYHNQNAIAVADCEADAGNGGYYYSICSIKIGNVHYPVAEA
jgi:hypothetical protein